MFPAILVTFFHCFGGVFYLPGGDPDARWAIEPEYSAISPDGKTSAVTMRVERGEFMSWQTWVIHANTGGQYQASGLSGEPEMGDSYGPTLHLSPGGQYLFEDRKICAGENFAMVYTLKDGKYVIDSEKNRQTQEAPMSELLRPFFDESTQLGDCFDHYWVSWLAWDRDGQSVEVDISGSHIDGDFGVDGWKAHFNLQTGQFYLTEAEAISNRKAIIFNERIPKDERVFRSAVDLPKKQ